MTPTETLDRLRNHPELTPEDKTRLGIAHNAVITTIKAYNDDPTVGTKRNLDSAEQFLAATVKELDAKYFPPPEETPEQKELSDIWSSAPAIFPHRKAVEDFVSQHFQRSTRSVRRDLATVDGKQRKAALCFPRADGKGYDLLEVQRYVNAQNILPRGVIYHDNEEQTFEELALLKKQKIQAERDRTRAQAEREQLELAARKGELVPAALLQEELAKRIRFFRQDLRQVAKRLGAEIIHHLEADAARIPALKALMIQRMEGVLNRYYEQASETGSISIETEEPEDVI